MNQKNSYLIIVGYSYPTYNQLEEEVQIFLRKENRRLIEEKDLPDYQEQLLEQIRICNSNHPHTEQIEAFFHNPGLPCLAEDTALAFKGTYLCNFTIYSSTRK